MTERERLLKICKEGHNAYLKYQNPNPRYDEFLTDYLLANDVIVPPCKVGDKLYQVTRNFISVFRVRFIEIGTCGNLFLHTDLISGIVYTGELFRESEIGKTVFLTKEEAEKALKERENNDL